MTSRNEKPLILGIGGTVRPASSSEKALRVSMNAAAAAGCTTVTIVGADLDLPMYNPSDTCRTPMADRLVDLYRRCDGIVISTPAYHGSISGMVKNALDYAEDLREGERVYFDGLGIGLITCAAGWQAPGQTLGALRSIAHALRGWPTPLGAALNTAGHLFEADGTCVDASAKFQLEAVGRQVAEFAWMRRSMMSPEYTQARCA